MNNAYFNTGALAEIQTSPAAYLSEPPLSVTSTGEQLGNVPAQSPVQLANTAKESSSHGALLDLVSEVKAGIFSHDVVFPDRHSIRAPNPFKSNREDGVDINAELLFISPGILTPRPHIGASINAASETNSIYAGMTWDTKWENAVFLEGFLGVALHDGKLKNGNPDRIEFGSRALFRLGAEFGWRFKDGHGISLAWDHMSNAGILDEKNQGIDNMGIRYSYRFKD